MRFGFLCRGSFDVGGTLTVVSRVFVIAVAAFWRLIRSFGTRLGCVVIAAFHAFWLVLAIS